MRRMVEDDMLRTLPIKLTKPHHTEPTCRRQDQACTVRRREFLFPILQGWSGDLWFSVRLTNARALIVAAALLLAQPAYAGPLTEVTPEVFAKVKGFAESARAKHPTSPTEASRLFVSAFNEAFGVPEVKDRYIILNDEIGVAVITPLENLRNLFQYALERLEPPPEQVDPSTVTILVNPRQMGAPNVSRVVLFRGSTEVKPAAGSDFGPREFENRMGAKSTLNAGVVLFPASAFTPNEAVKVLLLTNGEPIEWVWNAATSTLK